MFDIDKILGMEKKKKKVNINKIMKNKPQKVTSSGKVVEIHNHFHMDAPAMPISKPLQVRPERKGILSALESYDSEGHILNPVSLKKSFPSIRDTDQDGVPDIIDPAPTNPNIPKTMTRQKSSKRIDRMFSDMLGGN